MRLKVIDICIGLLLVADILFVYIFLLRFSFGAITDLYQGIPLFIFTIRTFLHFSLAISAALLFFRSSPSVKWVLLAYVAFCLLEHFWVIAPNTSYYAELVAKAESSRAIDPIVTTYKSQTYPFWWIWVLYLLALVYAFMTKKRYNQILQQTAADE